MKKLFFLSVAATLISSTSAFATIRRVGFFGTPTSGVDYTTFAAANTAAASGDTILVFPGPAVSGNISKKLIIIGTGYWLDAGTTPKGNANMQAFTGSSTATQVSFLSGSNGSTIMGFDFQGTNIFVGETNITVRRNRELTVTMGYSPSNTAVTISNLQILENYRVSVASYQNNGSSNSNMNISNNLISGFSLGTGNSYGALISNNNWVYDATLTTTLNGGTTTMSNGSTIDFGNGAFLFQNNIICSYTNSTAASNINYFTFSNGNNVTFLNNMALQSSVGTTPNWSTANGNVITPIANASIIFANFPAIGTNSADGRYQLGASSPALTVGTGGTPIGMYAGNAPYRLSLIPSIPTIYQLSSPQGNNPTGSTLQINLSTRGNN